MFKNLVFHLQKKNKFKDVSFSCDKLLSLQQKHVKLTYKLSLPDGSAAVDSLEDLRFDRAISKIR